MKRWIALGCALVCALGLSCFAEDRGAGGGLVQFGMETRTEAYGAEKYAEAEACLAQGDYAGAIAAFTQAQDYGDAAHRAQVAQYDYAEALLAEGSYAEASAAFAAAGDFRDAATRVGEPYYAQAEILLAAGDYDGAHDAFVSAGDYSDAAGRVNEPYYVQGEALLAVEDYEGAIEAFRRAGSYSDASQRIPEIHYVAGEACLTAGETAKAAIHFGSANRYEDSWERSMELWSQVAERKTFYEQAGKVFTIRTDGGFSCPKDFNHYSIVNFKPPIERLDASAFENAIALSGNLFNIVGLKADGTVVAEGDNTFGQCEVADWTDIVSVASGFYFTVGIRNDGTVVVTEPDYAAVNDAAEQMWYEAVDLSPIIHGLHQWSDIVEIAVCQGSSLRIHVVGRRADGTVVAVGDNTSDQCDVSDWTDIVAISASSSQTVGLKSDGTVVIAGNASDSIRQDILKWTNIIDIDSANWLVMGLKADGTVALAGVDDVLEGTDDDASYFAQVKDRLSRPAGWSNVADILVGEYTWIYCLRSDGTLMWNTDALFLFGSVGNDYLSDSLSGVPLSGRAAQRVKDMVEAQQAERAKAQAAEWEELRARDLPTLQRGDKGEDVQKLQQRLIDLGYLDGAADGDFGKKSEAAVAEFQQANGLESTGIADDATQKALYSESAVAK